MSLGNLHHVWVWSDHLVINGLDYVYSISVLEFANVQFNANNMLSK